MPALFSRSSDASDSPDPSSASHEPGGLAAEVDRLQQLQVLARWVVVVSLWVLIGLPCLWGLRSEIALWLDYFTWAAVRYTIAYNRWLAMGVSLCIGLTLSVLLWQSRNILWGRSARDQHRLRALVYRIRQQGRRHPLWAWVIEGRWR